MRNPLRLIPLVLLVVLAAACASTGPQPAADPYAKFVWPPPPNEPRIRLVDVIEGRVDVEASSRIQKVILGGSAESPYDWLVKPHGVDFDPEGRLLVTEAGRGALIRYDRQNHRMDVFGTTGAATLSLPLGLDVGPDGTIYVADGGVKQVLAFDSDGEVRAVYGFGGELTNPTDVALAADGSRLFVTDSAAHRIVVFETSSGTLLGTFGRRGTGPGEFNFPSSLVTTSDGVLYVVDQMNARIQLFDAEGEYLDEFGERGTGFGNFSRPKDIAVDSLGLIYVIDNAFNNVQLFDADFTLLTFIGSGGPGPGQFVGAAGVAVQGDQFAVVDQLGHRLQLFRYIKPRGGEGGE